jgi:hypothetical protein
MSSPLKFVQKIDAIKTFASPSFDYQMLNGVVSIVQLKMEMQQHHHLSAKQE